MHKFSRRDITQFSRFFLIGSVNAAIDFGILYGLIWMTGKATDGAYMLFKTISFTAATINSYVWNKFWTFKAGGSNGGVREVMRFIGVAVVSLTINVGVATLVVYAGPHFGFTDFEWAGIGAAVGAGMALLFSFTGYRLFVFAKK